MTILTQLFSAVCGQNLDHSWSPGGAWLPFCQRCTGLYCAAGLAALLRVWLKPRPTACFLAVHGGFLLLMVPFGFHWLPQGPILRSVTGVLFGFAVVAFLWLPVSHSSLPQPENQPRIPWIGLYSLVVCSTLLTVPALGIYGGKISFALLTVIGLLGAAALGMLILANTWLAAKGLLTRLVPPARTTP